MNTTQTDGMNTSQTEGLNISQSDGINRLESDVNIWESGMQSHGDQKPNDFLRSFYDSEEVELDSLGRKITHAILPESLNNKLFAPSKIGTVKAELTADGGAFDSLVDYGDTFEVDTEAYLQREKRDLSKRTKVSLFLLLVAIPVTTLIGMCFFRNAHYQVGQSLPAQIFGSRIYYFISLIIMIYSLIPFFMVFEGRKPQARELVVLATLIALNCAGRAAFFMIPDFKPIYAITIISGIAFGGESGFLVGAMTMLVSNFLFGQGPWTPWQMLAMGLIGFLSGILYQVKLLPAKRLPLSIFGFLMGFIVYGGIMNPAAMFMSIGEPNWKTLLAYYISGVPVDLIKGASTFIFLWIGAGPMLEKLTRIKIKYGLIS